MVPGRRGSPARLERHLFLSPRFNAFFKHGEAELFLARRDAAWSAG